MAWRDQLRDASFRGVPFSVDSADGAYGRRTALHEYPLRDKPYVEDLGRKARQINLEAIVLGPDYMTTRDALINAIEQAGAGKLVHPYYGEMQVCVSDSGRVRESTHEGGMARISLSFIESGDVTYPSAVADTRTVTASQADLLNQAGVASFASRFSIAGLPAFPSLSALATITQITASVSALARYPLGDILGRGVLDGLLGTLNADASSLFNTPSTLAQSVLDVTAALRTTAPDAGSAAAASTQLAAFTPTPALGAPATATRMSEATNQAAIVELVRVGAVSQAALAIADVDFDSYDSAIALRDTVTAAIDVLLDTTIDDQVFLAASALRAAVVKDVSARGADLAHIARYTPTATLPAIVLAYALYEDPERDADILARNSIPHPGFVPAGQSIEVLIDA